MRRLEEWSSTTEFGLQAHLQNEAVPSGVRVCPGSRHLVSCKKMIAAAPRPSMKLLEARPLRTWLSIGVVGVYIALCWMIYSVTVSNAYANLIPYTIEADSGAYFAAAGVNQYAGEGGTQFADQVSLGGSVIGPAVIALIFRTPLNVAIFNCALFGLSLYVAGSIPGVRRRVFAVLMVLNALTLSALMTLNKEILALAGMVFFAKYLYSKKRPLWLLGVVFIISTMARWQQTAFMIIYLVLQARPSPFRNRPKWGIATVIGFFSVAWAVIAWRFSSLLSAYMALQQEITTGTVARLNAVQAHGGFFVVVWPKLLMNLAGRLVQVDYVLHGWVESDFHELQNSILGNLHSVAMLTLLAVTIYKGRFRLARPMIHFAFVYMMLSAISPLIQNRYEYPAYVLLALEMARKEESLEPVEPMRMPRRLRSLEVEPAGTSMKAGLL